MTKQLNIVTDLAVPAPAVAAPRGRDQPARHGRGLCRRGLGHPFQAASCRRDLGARQPARMVHSPVCFDLKESLMRRRTFVASTLAAAMAAPAFAANGQSYRQGLVEEELAAGRTVFLDFYTDWCTTCRAQGKAIRDLMDENPAYEANVSFIKIDWDQHAQSSIATRLNIPGQAPCRP